MDIIIVGGGLGGCALAAGLAQAGLDVEVLERTTEYTDRVRGEWMAPWGVAEAKRLGLYDALIGAGGHHLSRHIGYDELVPPEIAEQTPVPIAQLHPESPGPLCLEHVRLQEAVLAKARAAGVTVRRGVSEVEVTGGDAPRVRFLHDDTRHQRSCRLVVGADGRASTVRRQVGLQLEEDPIDHLIAGLLIDGADGWPEDLQATGKAGDIHYLIFPQGHGKVRLYADFDSRQSDRFSGEGGAAALLAAFDLACVPRSGSIASATPIGPCRSYPSQSAIVPDPRAPGVVLMGDAAGFNDPILGQGLSVTLRDARSLRDLLIGGDRWESALFEPYVEERRERMRRLSFAAAFITDLFARFDPESVERRVRAMGRIQGNPELFLNVVLTAFAGPEVPPAEIFTPEFHSRVFDP